MNSSEVIQYWDREKKALQTERVYGDGLLNLTYGNLLGQALTDKFLTNRFVSQLVGGYQSTSFSVGKVANFIEKFDIPMHEFKKADYASFNDFFIREFKPGMRKFPETGKELGAFSEGRYLAYESVNELVSFPVKGKHLNASAVLQKSVNLEAFKNGPVIISRLCPTDYHRYHYPDKGRTLEAYRVHGKYHSVNPIALKNRSDIFSENERYVSILETEHFGKLGYVEVGALCVGKIVQTHSESEGFNRGDEKGYFLFGGSTVILFGQKGLWKPSDDLLEQTQNQTETLVKLGDTIATAI